MIRREKKFEKESNVNFINYNRDILLDGIYAYYKETRVCRTKKNKHKLIILSLGILEKEMFQRSLISTTFILFFFFQI